MKKDNTSRKKDRYVLKKYVFAKSALEAIKLDKKASVIDCYVDADYLKEHKEEMCSAIGFDDGHDSHSSFDEE